MNSCSRADARRSPSGHLFAARSDTTNHDFSKKTRKIRRYGVFNASRSAVQTFFCNESSSEVQTFFWMEDIVFRKGLTQSGLPRRNSQILLWVVMHEPVLGNG